MINEHLAGPPMPRLLFPLVLSCWSYWNTFPFQDDEDGKRFNTGHPSVSPWRFCVGGRRLAGMKRPVKQMYGARFMFNLFKLQPLDLALWRFLATRSVGVMHAAFLTEVGSDIVWFTATVWWRFLFAPPGWTSLLSWSKYIWTACWLRFYKIHSGFGSSCDADVGIPDISWGAE